MKRFHQWLIGISLMGMLASGIASASFSGGGGGLSITEIITGITGIFAKLDATNTFVKDQKINDPTALAGGTYSGVRLQTTERASYCLGPSDGFSNETCLSGGALFQIHGRDSDIYDTGVTGTVTLAAQPKFNRVWIGPTGSTIIGGGTGAPDVSFGVGSPSEALATLAVDTTNDWIKILPISAPAAGECDSADEKGRMYFDSTANAFKYCNGTAWDGFADGNTTTFTGLTDTPANYTGAAGKSLRVNAAANAVEFVDVGVAVKNFYGSHIETSSDTAVITDTNITVGWNHSTGTTGQLDLTRLVAPSSGSITVTCETSSGSETQTTISSGSTTNITGNIYDQEQVRCTVAATLDTAYPFYNIVVNYSSSTNGLAHFKMEKVTP